MLDGRCSGHLGSLDRRCRLCPFLCHDPPRTRFAFRPLAKATAAIDTPGLWQADTTFVLNSAPCVRRRRRTILPSSKVPMCPPKNQVDTIILSRTPPSKMTSPAAYFCGVSHVGLPQPSALEQVAVHAKIGCDAVRQILSIEHAQPDCDGRQRLRGLPSSTTRIRSSLH